MALSQSALLEILDAIKEADVADRVRESAATIYQALIEAELTAVIGAEPHERTDARTGQRNGHRSRTLSTSAGDLELRIPKLRHLRGSALGFRNLTNYIARSLLETGGFRPRLHPGFG